MNDNQNGNHKNLKDLHNFLTSEGYELPDYAEFENDMSTPQNLQDFYTFFRKEGYELPTSFSEFESDMGFGKQTAATTQPTAQQTTATQQPTEQRQRNMGTPGTMVGATPWVKPPQQPTMPVQQEKKKHTGTPGDTGVVNNPYDFTSKPQEEMNKRAAREEVEQAVPKVYHPEVRSQYIDKTVEEYAPELGTAEDWTRRNEEAQKAQKEHIADQVEQMLGDVESMRSDRLKELGKGYKRSVFDIYNIANTPGTVQSTAANQEQQSAMNDEQLGMMTAAERKLKKLQKTITEAQRHADDPNWFAEFGRGMGAGLSDISTWDFGITDLADVKKIQKALEKYDRISVAEAFGGESDEKMTPAEQALLDAVATEIVVNEYYGSDLSNWYKGGQSTAVSIPFMASMMVSPAMAAGRGTSAAMARYITKRFAQKAAKNAVQKGALRAVEGALKASTRLGIDAGAATLHTAMFNPASIEADTRERMRGQITPTYDSEGNVRYGRRIGGESESVARRKAAINAFIENESEMLGDYIPGLKLIFGNSKLAKRFLANRFVSNIANIERRAQFHGFLPEAMEEIVGGVMNAAWVGDQTLDADPETGVFSKDNLSTIAISIGATTVAMGCAKLGGYGVSRAMLGATNKEASKLFGEEWNDLRTRLQSDDMNEVSSAAEEIRTSDKYTDEQKKAAIKYATLYTGLNAYEHMEANEVDIDAKNANDTYKSAYEDATSEEVRHDITIMMEQSREKVRQTLGDEILRMMEEEDPLSVKQTLEETQQLTDEQAVALADYVAAHSAVAGIKQRIEDDADAMVAQMREQGQKMQHVGDGAMHSATLKDGREVFITNGDVVMNDEGSMPDAEKSSGTITVYDPAEGKVVMIAPSEVAELGEVSSAEDFKNGLMEERQKFVQQQMDAATGRFNPQPGDQIPMPQGTATVLGVDNTDVVLQMPDGTQQAMPIEQIQQNADEIALQDYQERHPEEQRPTEQAPTMNEGRPQEYETGMKIVLRGADGKEQTATVLGRARVEQYKGRTRHVDDPNGKRLKLDIEGDGIHYRHPNEIADQVVGWYIPQEPAQAPATEQPTTPTEATSEAAEQPTVAPEVQMYEQVLQEFGEDAGTKIEATAKAKEKKLADAKNKLDAAKKALNEAEYGSKEEQTAKNNREKAQAEYDAALADNDLWQGVRREKNKVILAEQERRDAARKAEEERRRAEIEAAQQRERQAYAAEMERRKRVAEEAAQAEAEAAENMIVIEGDGETAKRMAEINKQKTLSKKIAKAKELYGDYFDDNFDYARDAMELSAMNMPKISWGDINGERGLQSELGSNMTRGVGGDADLNGFAKYIAKDGEGLSFAEAVKRIYSSGMNWPTGTEYPRFEDSEIRDAMLDLFRNATTQGDISNYAFKTRLEQAERELSNYEAQVAMAMADEEIRRRYGMEPAEYEAWIAMLEQDAAAVNGMSEEEYNNFINNGYEQETGNETGERQEEGAGELPQQESEPAGVEENGVGGEQQEVTEQQEAEEAEKENQPTEQVFVNHRGAEYIWNDFGICLNPNITEYEKGKNSYSIKTAQTENGWVGSCDALTSTSGIGSGVSKFKNDKFFDTEDSCKAYHAKRALDFFNREGVKDKALVKSLMEIIKAGITAVDYTKEVNDEIEALAGQLDDHNSANNDALIQQIADIMAEAEDMLENFELTDDLRERFQARFNAAEAWMEANVWGEGEQTSAKATITPAQYTTKRGKVLDMQLVKFKNELTKEQMKAAKEFAKSLKGWWSKNDNGFMMRSKDEAQALIDTINNPEAVKDEQPVTVNDIATAADNAKLNEIEAAEKPVEAPKQNTPHYSYDIEEDARDHRLKDLREQYKDNLPTIEALEAKIKDLEKHIKISEEMLSRDLDDLEKSLEYTRLATNTGYLHAFQDFLSEVRRRKMDEDRDNALAAHGVKIGDKVIYKGKEATIHDAESRYVVLDTGLAPVLYEQTEWENVTIPGAKKAEEPKRLVSDEQMDELKEKLRKKLLGQLNVGIDPELLEIGLKLAIGHIERGATKFADFAKNMIADLGDMIRPYLKSFYNGARDLPEMAAYENAMSSYDEVRGFDVMNFDKEAAERSIIATAEHNVKENEVEQQTEQVKNEIKTTRNEQRKENEQQTEADTQAIVDEATSVADEAEGRIENATTEQELNDVIRDIDSQLDKVNEQLALLGYYEADEVESDLHEAYGYRRNAEKKAVKDADNLARLIAKDLGIEVGRKKLAKANIAPAGGNVSFSLPLSEGTELYVSINLEPDGITENGNYKDGLRVTHAYYRIEAPGSSTTKYLSPNRYFGGTFDRPYHYKNAEGSQPTYKDVIDGIREDVRKYLPDFKIKEPADNKIEKKPLKKKDNKEKQELPLLDLFSGVEEEQEKAKSEGRGFVEFVASSLPEDRVQIKNGDTTFSVPEKQQVVTAEQKAFSDAVASDMLTALATNEKPYRSIADLRKRAQSVGMTVDTDGRDDILLQELVEDGLVKAAREVIESGKYGGRKSRTAYEAICNLYDLQPTIAQRSSNRIKMQQYSTPLPMAFVSDMFAWKPGTNIVLEPTAGNGMLVFAIPTNDVVVNELDKTRLANLRGQGFLDVKNLDALTADFGGTYDAVIANPPFGKADAKEYDGKSIAGLDEQITLNALSAMKDNGRAAIIIGGNMEYGKNGAITNNRAFWTYLYDHYNVKGVVDMEGKLYAKQGTTYPTRMILIDGRRSDEERTQTKVYPPVKDKAVRKAETFEDLYDIVNEINNSIQKTNGTEVLRSGADMADAIGQTGDTPVRGGSVEYNENATNERGRNRRSARAGSTGRNAGNGVRQTESEGGSGVRRPADTGLSGENKPLSRNADRTATETSGELAARKTGRDGLAGVQNVADGQRQRNGLEQTIKEKKARALDMEKLPYRPHNSAFSLESVAPAAMVEAMDNTLTEIEKTYRQSIDEFVTEQLGYDSIDEMHNALAAEQVDSVAMALHQMSQGNALIIGDQTGVGKGRQMAALIRWAVKVGKKPIFITQKADLFSDIYRDLVDVGSGDLRPFIFNSDGTIVDSNGNVVYKPMPSKQQAAVFASGELPEGYDFAVLTYSQVNTGDSISLEQSKNEAKDSGRRGAKVSKAVKGGKPTPKATFLRDIAKDNYLFLDESHTAAGDSNVGAYIRSIIGIKGDGAKAVTFASATFAKRPDTMPMYALRTAMSEANIEQGDLIGIIEKGGVTLQEIMSRALTESGQMVRRERDMSDVRTDWETVSDAATVKRARENYDKTIEAFNAIIRFQEMYVKPMIEQLSADLAERQSSANVKKGTDKMGVENVPFASKTYNYTKQLMLALKADAIVDRVAQEIEAGRHPVIALESTMEASLKDYAIDEVIEEPTFSASLLRGLDTVMQYTVKDEDGNESHMRYQPSALGVEGERAYYELQNFIREATKDVFISPLDAIIEKLHERGYKVGELTGRNTYAERDSEGNVVVKRRTDKDKKRMQREFNNGTLDVLILNKSASTGISLHASKNFEDQRQRSMIIAQPLSDINDYMQMIGRIDRTGQVHRGYYINLGLPVPAESRFLMMLSTKLKSLNANTTTSQESESNSVDAPDLLNKYGSQVVVEYLRDNPDIYIKMGDPLKLNGGDKSIEEQLEEYKPSKDDAVARKITGYVALLSTAEQEAFYNDVVQRYTDLIKYLDSTGTNDLKITVMPLKAKTLKKKVSSEGKDPNGNNPFAGNAYVEEVEMDVLRKPMKAEEVRKTIEQLNKPTGSEKGRLATASKEKAVGERVLEIVGQVQGEADAKIQAENERYEAAKVKAAADIAKYAEKINGQQRTAEEKADAIARYTEETNEKVEKRHTENVNVIKARASKLVQSLQDFTVGSTYLLPQSTADAEQQQMFRTPAIFCGFKVKKNGITPSTSFAVFATLDGRRRVEVKFTDNTAIEGIRFVTDSNWNEAQSITLDNWDSQIPTDTRKKGYIMTGNILQAVADTQDEFGNYPGQLISYSDIDGNIHDGILMPDQWNPGLLRTSGVPIIAKLSDIKKFEPVTSQDGKVEITGSEWSGEYYLTVPKSKKDGAAYFENEKLLSLIHSNGFYPYRGNLRADILQKDIEKVVRELDRLGVRVKGEDDADIRFRSLDPESDNVVDNAEVGTRPLSDREKVAKLEAEPKVKVYRSMQLIDGKLYPPMSAKSEGQLREPSEIGVWEEADERPDLADNNGKFTLNKGNGKSLKAAYNPYIHTSRTMLNDQFSEAQSRPNLVVVEMEVPESELTSDYKAEKAKDSVGAKQWKAGVIQGQLSGTREVILSRWAKPVRIVPDSEVAANIAEQIDGQVEVMPSNVVTPSVRAELEKLGVQFVETDNTGKIKDGPNKGKTWASVYGKKASDALMREGDRMARKEVSYDEALASAKAAGYTKKQFDAMLERRRKNVKNAKEALADTLEKLRLSDKITFVETVDEVEGLTDEQREQRRDKKGWYLPKSDKIVIILDNHRDQSDVLKTILHEGVAHHGLRAMFGKAFDDFLDNVYAAAEYPIREQIDELAKNQGLNIRTATEEYLAGLAEDTNFEEVEKSPYAGWWTKIKQFFFNMLDKLGNKGAFTIGDNILSDNELRYILWRSYQNLVNPGRYRSFVDTANDVVMQGKLKVGEYAENNGEQGAWYAPAKAAEPSAVAEGEDYERRDREFADAVENGDKDKVKKLITEAADEAMPNSKVRDKKGNLRVMYHGTVSDNQFTKFDGDIYMFAKQNLADQYTHKRRALSVDPKQSGRVMPVFVNLENPLEVDAKRHLWRNIDVEWSDKPVSTEDIVKFAKENGYDGVIIKNVRDNMFDNDTSYSDEVIAFDSSQVKSTGPTYEQTRRRNFPWDTYDEMKEVYGATYDDNGDMIPLSERFNNDNDDIRFRDGDFTERDRVAARDHYERMVASSGYQFQEAVQDSMLGLRKAYEAILGKKGLHIEDVEDYENAYMAENLMSSVNGAEQGAYFREYMKPLLKAIHDICGNDKKARQELSDYMMAKHGLERNLKFAERDALAAAKNGADFGKAYQQNRNRDYAGLTALTGEADIIDAEAVARQMVADFEAQHDTTKLWEKVNDATKTTLAKMRISGILSEDGYTQIRDMFDYYIPLRGWDETTSDEVYGYLTSDDGPLRGGSIMKHAEGRSSKADDPIATIALMADTAIRQANRNVMKQKFLTFVEDHPSDLVSVSKLWLKYDAVNDEWVPVFADIQPNDSAADVERKVEAFEQRMEQLAQQHPDQYKSGSDARNIPYKVVKGNMKEHQVLVKRGGETYVLTINGNPRAAQALNGLTNPNVEASNATVKALLKVAETTNQWLSAAYTTRTPDFVVSNFFRDMLYSNCMTWVKEGPAYAIRFNKNFGMLPIGYMDYLFQKWENGTLDENKPLEKAFKTFMMAGGETGYTNVRDIESYKKAVAKELKRQSNWTSKALNVLGMQLDIMNRAVENKARFAAFLTSQEMGRSVMRSAYDAKEVSVNFNKKGAGDKFAKTEGETLLGKIGSYMSGAGRLLYVFWNASVQGMTNFGRAAKRHPGKFTAAAATMFTLGAIIPLLAELMTGGDDDDDDKDAYYNLPEYIRRSNICLWLGDKWLTIPLPIEFRAVYGMGELATGVITGKEHYSDPELARQMISQASQVLPLDFMEGEGGLHAFVPSQLKPFVEASENKSWTGLPIYKDTPWNKNEPNWTKVYKNADKHIVAASRTLNELTADEEDVLLANGDMTKVKGAVDINPAQVEYVLNGYLGGYFKVPNQLIKMAETAAGAREFEWRNMMLANRLMKEGDERTANRKLRNEYFDLKDEYEDTKKLLAAGKKKAEEGSLIDQAEYIANLNYSPKYARYEIFDKYRKDINDQWEIVKDENTTPEERAVAEAKYYELLREMVDAIHAYEAEQKQ